MESVKRKSGQNLLVLFCMSAMFFFAVSVSMIGIVLPTIIEEYQISLAKAGIITVAQNAGGIIALSCCGYLSDRFGKLKVITVIFTAMTLALLDGFISRSFFGFVIVAMILGLSASALNMLISAYLSDLFPERSAFYVNLGGVLFGLGSVLGPVYIMLMTALGMKWRAMFGTLGILCFFSYGLLLICVRSGNTKSSTGKKDVPSGLVQKLLSDRKIWIFTLAGFFYMAHSSAFMAWIPTWLSSKFSDRPSYASGLMTIYWISILLGRILSTAVSERISFRSYMILANLVGGIGMLAMTIANGFMIVLLLVVVGISTAAVFQVCLAGVCSAFPEYSGTASSIVALAACIGGTLSCYAAGLLADGIGFAATLVFLGVVLLIVAAIIVVTDSERVIS